MPPIDHRRFARTGRSQARRTGPDTPAQKAARQIQPKLDRSDARLIEFVDWPADTGRLVLRVRTAGDAESLTRALKDQAGAVESAGDIPGVPGPLSVDGVEIDVVAWR